jgi:hypothetical protein
VEEPGHTPFPRSPARHPLPSPSTFFPSFFFFKDILKDQWAAAMTLRTVLLSIQALMAAAEPDDPQDAVVARQYKDNRDTFNRTARHWARVYADGAEPGGGGVGRG